MNIGASTRLFLARRPWIRWIAVALLAAVAAVGVRTRLDAVDEARQRWEGTRTVWVADRDLEPGDQVVATLIDLPVVAVPAAALAPDAAPGVARQRIRAGEILVDADLTLGRGPAAAADDGQVVVPISDPLAGAALAGLDVEVYAEGIVLATSARIVEVAGDVVFVAVDAADGPAVAAAAQARVAAVVFTR